MKSISVFNNKGGVGKTTLTFHLAHALADLGHKTLIIDLDPQCNLTIFGMDEETLHAIWEKEDPFIDDFQAARDAAAPRVFEELLSQSRSIHFILKPAEDGTAELPSLPPPYTLGPNLALVPGRLSMHLYEDKIASRWSDVYQGDPLSIRTITRIRSVAVQYATLHGYEYVIMDTSPSLGALNKVIISTTDGFVIPCMPDMFSLYGIRNIGNALKLWKRQFETVYQLLSDEKRKSFPDRFVAFLGYVIYNAKKYSGSANQWDLAKAHYNYATQVPDVVRLFIPEEVRRHLPNTQLQEPIGGTAIMHSHATLPNMAQKYHNPMWVIPILSTLDGPDRSTISGNRAKYEGTRLHYKTFALDLIARLANLV